VLKPVSETDGNGYLKDNVSTVEKKLNHTILRSDFCGTLQEFIGLLLTVRTRFQKILRLGGPKRSGNVPRSVFISDSPSWILSAGIFPSYALDTD
jgi:hypothetical protein